MALLYFKVELALLKSEVIQSFHFLLPARVRFVKETQSLLRNNTDDSRLSGDHVACRFEFVVILAFREVKRVMAPDF
jgi:hypothetical protein